MTKAQKLRKSVFTALDAIYIASEKIAFKWDEKFRPGKIDPDKIDQWSKKYEKADSIPVEHFAQIIDNAKWDTKEAKGNLVAVNYVKNYNRMIELLFESSANVAKAWGTGIPLTLIKGNVETLKKAFDEGVKKPKK